MGEALEDELAAVEELTRERDLFSDAAAERLARIEALRHAQSTALTDLANERDLQAAVAAERLRKIDELAKDLADRRKETNEVRQLLERERDLHALAIEALTRERDLQAQAAEERFAVIEELRRTAGAASPPRSGNR